MSEEYKKGFADGFKTAMELYKYKEPTKVRPNTNTPVWPDLYKDYPFTDPYKVTYNTCGVCKMDLTKMSHYCCGNYNCPSRITCTI